MNALQAKFGKDGLTIIAVPCNQFGAQEPAPAAEVKAFVREQQHFAGVLTEKTHVNPPGEHALFTHLKAAHGGHAVEWNFEKWLMDADGRVVGRWESDIPVSDLEEDVQELLGGGETRDDEL